MVTKEEESPLTNASNDKDDITSNETGMLFFLSNSLLVHNYLVYHLKFL